MRNKVHCNSSSNCLLMMYGFFFQLGIIGMLVIAFLTDHCCHLIVQTKHHAIRKILGKGSQSSSAGNKQNYKSYDNPPDSGMDDEDSEDALFVSRNVTVNSDEEDGMLTSAERHEHIVRHMMYGDIGKLCFGKYGLGLVNFAIAVTQFGFCVAYFIFIGNTVHSLFPKDKCQVSYGNESRHCDRVYNISDELSRNRREIKILDLSGDLSSTSPSLPTAITVTIGNLTTPAIANITTATIANITTTAIANITTAASNITTTTTATPLIPMFEYINTAPDLKILVACPLLVFVFFSLIRNVRYLGAISVLANFAILGGCVSVFVFLILGKYMYMFSKSVFTQDPWKLQLILGY